MVSIGRVIHREGTTVPRRADGEGFPAVPALRQCLRDAAEVLGWTRGNPFAAHIGLSVKWASWMLATRIS